MKQQKFYVQLLQKRKYKIVKRKKLASRCRARQHAGRAECHLQTLWVVLLSLLQKKGKPAEPQSPRKSPREPQSLN